MPGSVLATKICVPPVRPHSISRSRLIARLEHSAGYDLLVVSAPAGFGKTTILSDWARTDGRTATTCWVSLDVGDNDPVRFWDHLVAALAPLGEQTGREALEVLHSPAPLTPESVLVALLNDLARAPGEFVIVLDDYHCIESPVIHSGITFLVDHAPAQMQLVLAGRADPPLPLARYRGRGSMVEIGTDDLRFTVEEATSLLKELTDAQPTAQEIEALNQRTEGWAVGLKMAALSMQEAGEVSAFISQFTGSNRFVMDYLIEEVLENQSVDVQRFLLETSLLEAFTTSLCDAVTGRTDSEKMLRTLRVANLFVASLDESGTWHRYEHLFADLLRHQLERRTPPEGVAELHRRASRWYADHGFGHEAISHSLAACDWNRATDLLAAESPGHLQSGEIVTLLGWFQMVPPEVLRRHPMLRLSHVNALVFTSQLGPAEEILTELETDSGLDDAMRGRVIAYRAVIAVMREEEDRAVECARAALALLPPDEFGFRAMLSLHLADLYRWKGQIKEAEPLFREAYALGRRDRNDWIAAIASVLLCSIDLWRGRLDHAIEQTRKEVELTGSSPAASYPHGFLADFLYERNDLDLALLHHDKSLEMARLLAVTPHVMERSYHIRMQICLARGDVAGAFEALDQIDLWLSRDGDAAARARRAFFHLYLALRRADEEEASRWGEAFEACGDLVYWSDALLLIRLRLFQGRTDEVDARLHTFYESLHTEYLSSEWPYWRIKARVCQALAAPDWPEARGFLAEALALARPERYVRLFADEGRLLIPLLRKAISEGIEQQFAAILLTLIETESRLIGSAAARHALGAPGILSHRELEILRLVAADMSNREIGKKLFISPVTVKVHLHNICEKLNVSSRTRAVAQARELHLL